MKKMNAVVGVFLAVMLLLTACKTITMQTDNPANLKAVTPAVVETSTVTATFDENNWENDPIVRAYNDGTLSYHSDDPMAFCNLFPDPYVAYMIGNIFHKEGTATTTYAELASYTGVVDIHPGYAKDLTGIGLLTGMTEFDCYKNDVTAIPAEIGKCKHLKGINIGKGYAIASLPPEIGQLTDLEELIMFFTDIKTLPPEIGNCKKLRILRLCGSGVGVLPDTIGNLTQLESLDSQGTGIKSLPDSICKLTKLNYLDLSYNHLTALPKKFGNLKSLETLNLFRNDIKKLPYSFRNLTKLQHLNVYDNYNLDEEYKDYIPRSVWVNG